MGNKTVIVVFVLAILIFGAVLYFRVFAPDTDFTGGKKTTGNENKTKLENCQQLCLNRGYGRGECWRGNMPEPSRTCAEQNGTVLTRMNTAIPDCQYQSETQAEVCCCFK